MKIKHLFIVKCVLESWGRGGLNPNQTQFNKLSYHMLAFPMYQVTHQLGTLDYPLSLIYIESMTVIKVLRMIKVAI
jgi:hypothetical protein